jgi:HlyD family secretion protein
MQAATRRRIFIIAVVSAVIVAVVYGFMPKPVPVDIAKSARAPMKVTIEEEGKTRVRERFVISSPVGGFMRRITLKVGDVLKKGELVAVLEPMLSGVLDPRSRAQAEASVSAAQSSLHAAEERARAAAAEEEYAGKNLERQKKLFGSGYIARDLYEQAESDMKRLEANRLAADASVRAARADLARAKATLRYSAAEGTADRVRTVSITAPSGGSVLKLQKESEGVVNAGDPLIDIGDPGKIEVKVEVLSADAVMIRPGTSVLFERWGLDTPLSGTVRIVEPEAFTKVSSLGVEEQRVLVIADITSVSEEWRRLGDGYRVEAKFVIWEGKDVLQVPAGSLFRKGEDWAVFVNDSGRAKLRQVKAGHRNGLTAEVLSGIAEGEEVIIHPDDTVRDGIRIRARQGK